MVLWCPDTSGINAFPNVTVNSPHHSIPKCIAPIKQLRAKAILLVPFWPTKPGDLFFPAMATFFTLFSALHVATK
jgi:hypothetical protein